MQAGIDTTIKGGGGAYAPLGRIDKFELVRELGEGGFGAVYLARDTVAGIDVAIKGLPPEVKHNESELEPIRANFALVSRLRHPNIVGLRDLHRAERASYSSKEVEAKLRVFERDTMVVMDYAPGATLAKWRRQFPDAKVPLDKAIEIARQIASALDAAHAQKVLHRDVKPENVMVETREDGSFVARVLDFGLAAEIRSSMGRVSRKILDTSGTRPYMAPEQWLGEEQNAATDQYALAVLFYELVAGKTPFASVFDCGDTAVMRLAVTTDAPKMPSSLPKNMRKALAVALAKKPEDRFASCGDFVAALEGRKAKVSRGGAEPRSGGGGRAALAVAALAVLALAGGGYFAWVKHDDAVKRRNVDQARFRQEVYGLKGKASQARDKNAKEEWHAWPLFDVKAKDLESAFRAGDAALQKDDYDVARAQFMKVRDLWYWLSSNKVERVRAAAAMQSALDLKKGAESGDTIQYAPECYSIATNAFATAAHCFKTGAFTEAADGFDKAAGEFRTAGKIAQKNKEKMAVGKRKEYTEKALAAFRATPQRFEEGFHLSSDADLNDADIQFFLGVCYDFGYGGAEKNDIRAAEWYLKAAEQGVKYAQYNIGNMYKSGRGVEKNYEKAVMWYRKAADQGDADAQCNLGDMYDNGWGVPQDYAEAVKWYRKSAEQGDADAQNNLGVKYKRGQGVEQDYAEAVKWYRKAAEQGNAMAQYNLGIMYDNGWGISQDYAEAVKWYRKSAEQGDDDAQRNLGNMYNNGWGVSQDYAEAVKWYRKSAEKGDADAQNNLGVKYGRGQGVEQDYAEAVKWYRKSAEQGNAMAQYNLGSMYNNGWGISQEYAEAVKWYRKSAEQGNANAQNNLGVKYEKGEGVEQDYAEAVKWYRKAAEQGDATAQFNLGDMYEFGKGVELNVTTAKSWYEKAAAQGNESAEKAIQRLKLNSTSMTYEAALAKFGINLNARFPSSKIIDVPVNADLRKVVADCPDGSTLKLVAGTYVISGTKQLVIGKNLRVIGVSPESSVISGKFSASGKSVMLVVENLSFREANKVGVWGPENGFLVVRNCRFDGCRISIGEGSMGVVSGVSIDGAEWTIDVSEGARAVVLDSRLTNTTQYFVIGFKNSRVYCENVRMDGGKDNGIRARNEGSLWFLRHCSIKNIKPPKYAFEGVGISIGEQVKVWLDDVAFESLTDAAVDNDGVCEHHNLRTSQCAKESGGRGRYVRRDSPIPLPDDFFK